jgi:4-hydroxyphenylpyruvate dioxygenase
MLYDNPAATNGFDFLEFTTLDPNTLIKQFESMGFTQIAAHKNEEIIIYQQNDTRFIINLTKNSHTQQLAKEHGPSVSAMGFRVENANFAYQHVLNLGAVSYSANNKTPYDIPAISGIGGSLIYFVDFVDNEKNITNYAKQFSYNPNNQIKSGTGLTYIDHVTHNLYRGNMDKWANFYIKLFNFREVRYFDIEGRMTGLKSRALTSPCGKIRIPLNESSDDHSQIEEFLKAFNGEGIQHIALGTDDIYQSVHQLQQNGLQFLDTPDTYYDLIESRLPKHGEPVDQLKKLRILIDGNTKEEKKLLLQIFTQNMLGPVFFEVIQRKGDEGFGEGNFQALFESIELDQIKRGVLQA